MIVVFLNNIYRVRKKKLYFFMLFLVLMSTLIALSLAKLPAPKYRVAYVTENIILESNEQFEFILIKDLPKNSKIVMGEYDVIVGQDGKIAGTVTRIASADLVLLQHFISGERIPAQKESNAENQDVKAISFMSMFLLIQGAVLMGLFAEDEELGVRNRILATSMSKTSYYMGHIVFNYSLLFVPTVLSVLIAQILTLSPITVFSPVYVIVLSLLCLLSISFSICVYSRISDADNANMLSSAIIVLTTIFSGGLYRIELGSHWFDWILRFLPQRKIFEAADQILLGNYFTFESAYVIMGSILMVILAVTIEKRNQV